MAFEEKDYLMVAEQNVLDAHWERVRNTRVWISADSGKETPFNELEDGHLRSIIKMLLRFSRKSCTELADVLVDELYKRYAVARDSVDKLMKVVYK